MNILFFCHADFASNSMGHIAGFATALAARGHACAAAIPGDVRESASALGDAPLGRWLFSETWEQAGALFPEGKPADIIHAWTPREHVRIATERYRQIAPAARLFVHLEDNEEHLAACFMGEDFARLRERPDDEIAARLPLHFTHPRRGREFLGAAAGVTGITRRLRDFVPAGVPFAELRPGINFKEYCPGPPDPALRARLGLGPTEKVLCYPGNSHFANLDELRTLYRAVVLLNAGGVPCRLLRTGLDTTDDQFETDPHVLHLGFVPRGELPGLLRLADVLVQPGSDNAFNRYRLPSKLPEFLASGRPVVMPGTNLAAELREGRDALFLDTGAPEEVAAKCRQVFADQALADRLAQGAAQAARRLFNAEKNTAGLIQFYQAPRGWRQWLRQFTAF